MFMIFLRFADADMCTQYAHKCMIQHTYTQTPMQVQYMYSTHTHLLENSEYSKGKVLVRAPRL